MNLSETYSVLDCSFYDGAVTGNTNGGFYYTSSTSEVLRTTDNTGTLVTNLTSSLKTIRGKYANSTELQFNDKSVIEFDLLSFTGDITLQLWKSNTAGNYVGLDIDNNMGTLSSAHIRAELTGSKVKLSVDDTEKINSNFSFNSSGDMSVRILLGANASFKYKDFKIYPI